MIDTFFPFTFSLKLQILAFLLSLFDKLVAKKFGPFSTFRRIPEHCKYNKRICTYVFYFTDAYVIHSHVSFNERHEVFCTVSFLGGTIGLLFSFILLKHKTSHRKREFRVKVILAAIVAPIFHRVFI